MAEWSNAETGVGPSLHQVTKDVEKLGGFSTAARIEIKLQFDSWEE